MPRAKDNAPSTVDSEVGFAALEAKVEEVQLESAIEAELAVEDAAGAATVMILEQAASTDAHSGADTPRAAEIQPALGTGDLRLDPPAAVKTIAGALAACAESTMRLQSDTLASFSRARSPGDLITAQLALGKQAMELYTSNMGRLIQAMPAFARGETAYA